MEIASGAVHVPDWLSVEQQRQLGGGLPGVGGRAGSDALRPATGRAP
ncbi:MAG: hypothetical protein WKF47_05085 [Geodermatophilaceae bacterium]